MLFDRFNNQYKEMNQNKCIKTKNLLKNIYTVIIINNYPNFLNQETLFVPM